jgi:hypothetical protein
LDVQEKLRAVEHNDEESAIAQTRDGSDWNEVRVAPNPSWHERFYVLEDPVDAELFPEEEQHVHEGTSDDRRDDLGLLPA